MWNTHGPSCCSGYTISSHLEFFVWFSTEVYPFYLGLSHLEKSGNLYETENNTECTILKPRCTKLYEVVQVILTAYFLTDFARSCLHSTAQSFGNIIRSFLLYRTWSLLCHRHLFHQSKRCTWFYPGVLRDHPIYSLNSKKNFITS